MAKKNKKIFTREEFEGFRIKMANRMARNLALQKKALDVLVEADKNYWIHQTNWLGEPLLNLPQDMFAIQEIIFRTKPDIIIETGVAWGGSLLFYGTLMEALGKGRVIGIDIFIPDDLKKRIASHGKISKRITLITGSSVDPQTFGQLKKQIKKGARILVILDSHHSHDHVLEELRLYSQFIKKDGYIVCGDTIVEDIPAQDYRERPWGPGNNPKTAVLSFLKENRRFKADMGINDKLLLSCNPGGYLKCIR